MSAEDEISIEGFLAPPTALVLSGGFGHPFGVTTNSILATLGGAIDVDIIYEPDQLEDLHHDLLIVNALWWTMSDDRYADRREEWSRSPSEAARLAVDRHVDDGGSVVAFHTAAICFDDWPGWRLVLGGAWDWNHSSHPPLDETAPVEVALTADHRIVSGLQDFAVIDEVYGWLDISPDVEALATSNHGGVAHPVLWIRELASGARVVYDALGHDLRSVAEPTHREMIRRSFEWALRGDLPGGAS